MVASSKFIKRTVLRQVALKFDQSLFEGSICVERVFIHLSFREEVHRGALAGYLPLAPNRMHRSAKHPIATRAVTHCGAVPQSIFLPPTPAPPPEKYPAAVA